MIPQLHNQSCVPCRGDESPINAAQRKTLMPQIPDWEVSTVDGVEHLRRQFHFENYMQGVSFAEKIGELAEMQDHHPRMTIDWRNVTVEWWTHAIKGLHQNDFIMAAKTDTVFIGLPGVPKDEVEKVNQRRTRDAVQRASEDSFPASDPPSWVTHRDEEVDKG